MAKRYLGYGYTNAQGIAKLEYDPDGEPLSHSYTGVGAGKIDIVAESGSLQSETYVITDTVVYDSGITGSTATWISSSDVGSMELTSTGRVISGDSTGSGSYFIQKPGSTGMYTWTDPCCIEFTVKEVTGDVRFQCYNTANSYVFDFSSVGNWRVTYDGTTFTRYLNGEQQGLPFDSALNNSRIGFIAQNGESVKFTDFMIYPI